MIDTTNDPATPPTQRSIGELVQSIRDELVGVVNQQIEIAKKEITALAIRAGIVAACAAVILFLLLSMWVMLLFAAAHGLNALGVPLWGSFLIVAGVFLLLALIAGLIAFLVGRKLGAPETTIETSKSAAQSLTGQRRSNSVSYDDEFAELYGKPVASNTERPVAAGEKAGVKSNAGSTSTEDIAARGQQVPVEGGERAGVKSTVGSSKA